MKDNIENFRLIKVHGNSPINWKFLATVDVTRTTGIFFKKKEKTTRDIFKSYAGTWFYTDSGDYTQCNCVEKLVRAFEAINGRDLEFCDTYKDKE